MFDKNASPHFKETYWFIVGITLLIISYVVAVTFLHIPKDNQKYVDIAFGFLLNMLVQNASYLTGGNPTTSKKNDDSSINLPPENKSEVTTTVKSEPVIDNSKKQEDGIT